jgi:predicted NBD/HSP70 family sugar kinase
MAPPVDGAGEVLALIRTEEATTISELAVALGVVRSTVTQRVDALTAAGFVGPVRENTGSRGRPAASYRFLADAGAVLAMHTGVTATILGVTDLNGEVLIERWIPTDLGGTLEGFVDAIEATTDELLTEAGVARGSLLAVGSGFVGSLELARQRHISGSPNNWGQADLAAALEQRFGVPAYVSRDVSIMGMAERSAKWPDAHVLICVKLGTGITSAIIVDGRPIDGAGGFAGELGHIKIAGATVSCGCGATGCLDAVAGGAALVRELQDQGLDVTKVTDVVALAERGDPVAAAAVRTAGKRVGEALASAVNLLNPEVICAWGFLADANTQLFAGIREGLYQSALAVSSAELTITRTVHGEESGVYAAARMALEYILAPASADRLIEALVS